MYVNILYNINFCIENNHLLCYINIIIWQVGEEEGGDVIEKGTGRNLDWKKSSEFWNAVQKINNPAAYSSPFKQTGNVCLWIYQWNTEAHG